jgi:hypothetical protein
MATKLKSILEDFADASDQAGPQKLGGIATPPDQASLSRTSARMSTLARKNGYMMHVAVGVVLALLMFCIALVLCYRSGPKTAILVMGGNGLQLVLLVWWLRRQWIEKTAVETLLIATEELPPAEAAKLLLGFYFKALKAR